MTMRANTKIENSERLSNLVVIINPASGRHDSDKSINDIKSVLEQRGARVDVFVTLQAGDAFKMAQEAAKSDVDAIVAAGGDGTIMEVLSGLVKISALCPVIIIPLGTGNILARILKIPLKLIDALETGLSGKTRDFDLGYIKDHDRCFAIAMGAGYDALIMQDANREEKDRLGMLAYWLAALKHLFTQRRHKMVIELDGVRLIGRAHSLIIFNMGKLNVAGLDLGPGASPHDGKLDVAIMQNDSVWGTMASLWYLLLRQLAKEKSPQYQQVRHIRIDARPALPVEADGEVIGKTPVEVEILQSAVRLCVPQDYQD